MSEKAWKILQVLLEWAKYDLQRSYMATWVIAEKLEIAAGEFRTHIPRTEWDEALDELMAKGLIAEFPDLHQRYHLVIQEKEERA